MSSRESILASVDESQNNFAKNDMKNSAYHDLFDFFLFLACIDMIRWTDDFFNKINYFHNKRLWDDS